LGKMRPKIIKGGLQRHDRDTRDRLRQYFERMQAR
jgi:hypothetical protein